MKSTTLTVAAAACSICASAGASSWSLAPSFAGGESRHFCRGTVDTKRIIRFCSRQPPVEHGDVSAARPSASGCLVRLGNAPPRGRRSGPVIQPGAQLGALGQAGTGGNRRGRRVASPCWEDCWPAKWRMGYRIRQRRPCASRPPSLDRGRDCDQVGLIAVVISFFESKGPP